MLPLLTCPFRSALRTILSCFDTLSINPSRSYKNYFSPPCYCQPVEHTCLLYFVLNFLPPVSWPLVCLTLSSPPRHFQPAPPSPLSLSHFFFHQLYCRIVCSHLRCSLLYSLSTLFPVGTVYLCSIMSASSLPFPVIVSIFKVPTLISVHLSPFTAPAASSLATLLSFSSCFH